MPRKTEQIRLKDRSAALGGPAFSGGSTPEDSFLNLAPCLSHDGRSIEIKRGRAELSRVSIRKVVAHSIKLVYDLIQL